MTPETSPKPRGSLWLNFNILWDYSQERSVSCFVMTAGGPRHSVNRLLQTPFGLIVVSLGCKHSPWHFLILLVTVFTFMYINWAVGSTMLQDCNVKLLWCTLESLQLRVPFMLPWINLLTECFCPLVVSRPLLKQPASYKPVWLLWLLCLLCLLPWRLLLSGCTHNAVKVLTFGCYSGSDRINSYKLIL